MLINIPWNRGFSCSSSILGIRNITTEAQAQQLAKTKQALLTVQHVQKENKQNKQDKWWKQSQRKDKLKKKKK